MKHFDEVKERKKTLTRANGRGKGIAFPCLYAVMYVVSLLPMSILYKISGVLYWLMCRVFSYRKEIVIQNLSRAFPGKRYNEIHALAREFYHSFCDSLAEVLKSVSIPARHQREKFLLIGGEMIERHLEEGRHVIAGLGHCGNWEILNILPTVLHGNVSTVYKPLSTRCIDRFFLKVRSRFGMKMVSHRSVARHFIYESTPSLYLLLAAQCPRAMKGTLLFDFLHQPTRVFPGIERLAHAINAVVVYLHVTKMSRGKYRVECKEICLDPRATAETEITGAYLHHLEENIVEDPSGWLWSHKRWKR